LNYSDEQLGMGCKLPIGNRVHQNGAKIPLGALRLAHPIFKIRIPLSLSENMFSSYLEDILVSHVENTALTSPVNGSYTYPTHLPKSWNFSPLIKYLDVVPIGIIIYGHLPRIFSRSRLWNCGRICLLVFRFAHFDRWSPKRFAHLLANYCPWNAVKGIVVAEARERIL
jgi:hypothetical protein